ncbi:MAG: glutaredoxin domain-containing protein [Burkholderiales bacterium]
MKRVEPLWMKRTRRLALFSAAALTLLLVGLDRYAASMYRPDADSRAVVIYTTAWCPYCARLRSALKANDIPFAEHDVEKSLQGQMGFWTLRGRGVPVSVIGAETVYGYDVPRLTSALAVLGYDFLPVDTAATIAPAASSIPGQR